MAVSWFSLPAIILSFCVALIFFAASARAEPGVQTLTYDVYTSGFHAVEAKITFDLSQKSRYDIFVEGYTRGILKNLAPWEGTFATQGWVLNEGKLQPETHKSTATWRGEGDIKEYAYGKDGRFKSLRIKDHDKPVENKKTEDEVTQGTIDVLTATLAMLKNIGDGNDCAGTSEIFDGKRRFEMIFNHEGHKDLKRSGYNVYEGPSTKCTVEVKPLAGKWHKKPRGWLSIQEQGRERGTMPTVWVGQIGEDSSPVPVKVMVKTAYGTLFMHLVEYHNGDEYLIAEKRED